MKKYKRLITIVGLFMLITTVCFAGSYGAISKYNITLTNLIKAKGGTLTITSPTITGATLTTATLTSPTITSPAITTPTIRAGVTSTAATTTLEYSFTAADSGKTFTNENIKNSGELHFFLPEASTTNTGLVYTVACSNPNALSILVRPQAADMINAVIDSEAMTVGDGMGAVVIGASATFTSYSSIGWIITANKKDADWEKWTWK